MDEEWWREHLKGFGWPEEGSRDLGSIEGMYQAFKARLLEELAVEVPITPAVHRGRLVSREEQC